MAMLEEWALKESQPPRGCKAKKLDETGSPTQPSQASKPKKQDKGNVFPENLENPVNKTASICKCQEKSRIWVLIIL